MMNMFKAAKYVSTVPCDARIYFFSYHLAVGQLLAGRAQARSVSGVKRDWRFPKSMLPSSYTVL